MCPCSQLSKHMSTAIEARESSTDLIWPKAAAVIGGLGIAASLFSLFGFS
jgi:hypothetical protein